MRSDAAQSRTPHPAARAGIATPKQALHVQHVSALAGAARVLVPVPTSSTGSFGLPADIAASEVVYESRNLARALSAFSLDPAARRLSSLRCAVGFAARAHAVSEKGKRSDKAWMVTLTYADADGWRSDHLKTAFHRFRQWANRQGFAARYVWVAEIQPGRFARTGKAVVHYHAVVWLPQGVRMPKWDVRGWWGHGRCQRVLVKKSAVGYLMKYLSKGTDLGPNLFPPGARVYGCGGLDASLRRARRWLRLPSFVQGNSDINDPWQRRVGGGWNSPSGAHFVSEFVTAIVGGVRSLIRVARHATLIEASGPFSWCKGGA